MLVTSAGRCMSEETTAVPIYLALPFEVSSETTRPTRVFNMRLESTGERKMTSKPICVCGKVCAPEFKKCEDCRLAEHWRNL